MIKMAMFSWAALVAFYLLFGLGLRIQGFGEI
jgi:hypothetical protein